jgi:hypothetical protein
LQIVDKNVKAFPKIIKSSLFKKKKFKAAAATLIFYFLKYEWKVP